MKNKFDMPQLFLRITLGTGFLLPVMDRFGWLGPAGVNGNAWGNWDNFSAYTNSLIPFLSQSHANFMAILATIGETFFGIMLIVDFKTKLAAIGSFLLTLCFAFCMFLFADPRASFTYSVFVDSAASILLATLPMYKWSLDANFSTEKI